MRIRRVHWLAAVRATHFEKKQTLSSGGAQIDLLIQELEKVDPSNITNCLTEEIVRKRTPSLALTTASDNGIQYEKLVTRSQALINLPYSNKKCLDSPSNSRRNTPPLSQHHRKLFRSATTTTASTPYSSLINKNSPIMKH